MQIDDVIDMLLAEQRNKVSSRFPCRAILINSASRYWEVLDKLGQISDVEYLSCGKLCEGDTLPQFSKLTTQEYENRWVVLTGVSEYLRLFTASEAKLGRFFALWHHQVSDATATGRIIIPLWGCADQWRDPDLKFGSDLRQQDATFWCLDEDGPEENFELVVYADSFREQEALLQTKNNIFFHDLPQWLDYWAKKPQKDAYKFVLITGRYRNILPQKNYAISSGMTVKVFDNMLTFFGQTLYDGESLTEANCPLEAQKFLLPHAMTCATVDEAILHALNMVTFDGVHAMSRWSQISLAEQHLVQLWFHRHNDGSYLHHCFVKTDNIANVKEKLALEILSLYQKHPEWMAEYRKLSPDLKKTVSFFRELDNIADYEKRLDFLCGNTVEEHRYLLQMVGTWMRINANQVRACVKLQEIYPELYAYLHHPTGIYDETLSSYFTRYKTHKLSNTLPEDDTLFFSNINPDKYATRFAILTENLSDDTLILWIDALGAEWLSLLSWALEKKCHGIVCKADIGRVMLPSETRFNNEWKQMTTPYLKKDQLDKLAHQGVIDDPSYYSCVEKQLQFVARLAHEVNDLLHEYHRVIITGDHGTSRLAARFFHKRQGRELPQGVSAGTYGRYGTLQQTWHSGAVDGTIPVKHNDGTNFLVFRTYDHFTQSGFATGCAEEQPTYGEVHGGATPEESLVCVVVVDSLYEIVPKATWQTQQVKIASQKATVQIHFTKPVKRLSANIGNLKGQCVPEPSEKNWTITFERPPIGSHSVVVIADDKYISMEELTIRSALGDEDDLL